MPCWKWCNLTPRNFLRFTPPTSTRKWVFSCLKSRFRGPSQNSFPYSISGFNAEPSQSAQRPHANPAAVQSGRHYLPRGTTVCVLFCNGARSAQMAPAPSPARGEEGGCPTRGQRSEHSQDRPSAVLHPNARCTGSVLNGKAGRAFQFLPPCCLTVQDPGLSSRGMRVRLPSRRPISLRKRRFFIRDRSPLCPIGCERSLPAA